MSIETKTTKRQVSAMDFVLAYNVANSAAEVATSLGLKIASVTQRANSLRKQNVNLKKFPDGRGGKRLNIAALNAAIATANEAVQ